MCLLYDFAVQLFSIYHIPQDHPSLVHQHHQQNNGKSSFHNLDVNNEGSVGSASSVSMSSNRLHCNNIWYSDQLPWQMKRLLPLNNNNDNNKNANDCTVDENYRLTDYQHNNNYDNYYCNCLFSVVQSTTGVSAAAAYKELVRVTVS